MNFEGVRLFNWDGQVRQEGYACSKFVFFCFSLTIADLGIRGLFKCSLSHFANIFVSLEGLSWALQVVQVMTGGRRLVTISLIIFVLFSCVDFGN